MSGQATSGRRPWSLVLASREVWPFVEGGGLGRYVWAAARLLAKDAEVMVLTSSEWREPHEELVRTHDPRLPEGVRFAFADEPEGDLSPFLSWNHAWSFRLLEAVAQLYPDGGPDILEMADYQAEGFAAAHARRGHDPRLRNTALAVRLHTSGEMCAVMNEEPGGLHLQVLAALERFSLRFADAVLEPGGNCVEHYEHFYGAGSLAPAIASPLPVTTDVAVPDVPAPPADGPLRLLYLSRIERRKGIVELIEAVRALPDAELELTVVGGDTASGPGGASMREHVAGLARGDPRIRFADPIPHDRVPRTIAEHHAVVVPTRWETFSYVVREALACNRPVIATPSGAIVDVIRPGESGWLTESATAEALEATLGEVLADRGRVTEMIEQGLPRAAFERDAPEDRMVSAYHELLDRRGPDAGSTNGHPPLARVTALVTSTAGDGDPMPTLDSLDAQHPPGVDSVVLLSRSGVFPGTGPVLARVGAVAPALGVAIEHTRAELLLLVPVGATLDPSFLQRAVAALDGEPEVAWVTAFAKTGTRPMHAPPGNYELPLGELDASPPVALIRRTALEAALAANAEEPNLFERLAAAGAYGVVLQERLVSSLPRRVLVGQD